VLSTGHSAAFLSSWRHHHQLSGRAQKRISVPAALIRPGSARRIAFSSGQGRMVLGPSSSRSVAV